MFDRRRTEVRREEEYEPGDAPLAPRDRPLYGPPAPGYNYRAVQIVWFVTGLIAVLIGMRFILKLTAASPQAEFVAFIYAVTGPLVAPFRGIFPDSTQGFNIFEPSSLIALVVYILLGWGIATLVKILTTPRGTRAVD